MKIKARVKQDNAIKIKEITLLSLAQYEMYKNFIPHIRAIWWLKTPDNIPRMCKVVAGDGKICLANIDAISAVCVRPALRCDPIAATIGSEITCGGMSWTVLCPTLLLCTESVDRRVFDAVSNNWETSDLRKWLNSSFLDMLFSNEKYIKDMEKMDTPKVLLTVPYEHGNLEFTKHPHSDEITVSFVTKDEKECYVAAIRENQLTVFPTGHSDSRLVLSIPLTKNGKT